MKNFLDVGESFQNKKIDAAFFERLSLFEKKRDYLFRLGVACLNAQPEGTNRSADQNFASGSFTGFAGDFDSSGVEAGNFFAKAQGRKLESVGTKRIGFDDLRARLDVGLVDTENRFRFSGIQLIETALRAHSFVEHGTHRTIGDQN